MVKNSPTSLPTVTDDLTRGGIVIGTAAYMSPEQARGKPVDKRTDIWSFGVVFYEMVTGRQAFRGETVTDTLAAILTRDPDLNALPAALPPGIRRLLARCLEKDRNRRLHDIADARIETDEALAEMRSGSTPMSADATIPEPRSRLSRAAWAAVAAAVGLALVSAAFFAGRRSAVASAPSTSAAAPSTRSIIRLPEDTRLAGWASPVLALSRDGRSLAFVATKEGAFQQLYVHRLDIGETRLVPDSLTAEGPFFSPDGQWVGFATDASQMRAAAGQLKKFSLSTGLTQTVCPIPDYFGGAWGEDGTIYFVRDESTGIWKVPAGGGTAAPLAGAVRFGGKEENHALIWPQLLPGGRSLLVSDENGSRWGNARVLDISTQELTDIAPSALGPRYLPTGHLVYLDPAATLFAVPFDPATRRTNGSPVAVARDVAFGSNGNGAFAIADSGVLVYASGYIRGSGRELTKLVRIDRTGSVTVLPVAADSFGVQPRVSSDGRRLAVVTWDFSLWIYDLERNSRVRLPNSQVAVGASPLWTPDGIHVAFTGTRDGESGMKVFLQKSDGSTEPEILLGGKTEKHSCSFAPGGELVYFSFGGPEESGVWILPAGGKGSPRRLIAGAKEPRLSPDGRWMAYSSGDSGELEVYVQKYPELGPRQLISAGGGRSPNWSRDGREILFRNGNGFYSASFEAGAAPKIGQPRLLFEKAGIRGYDVAPDGKGIYAVFQPEESGVVRELHLVTNWFEDLNRLAPAGKK
jgi:serine/threonine-protein kinase